MISTKNNIFKVTSHNTIKYSSPVDAVRENFSRCRATLKQQRAAPRKIFAGSNANITVFAHCISEQNVFFRFANHSEKILLSVTTCENFFSHILAFRELFSLWFAHRKKIFCWLMQCAKIFVFALFPAKIFRGASRCCFKVARNREKFSRTASTCELDFTENIFKVTR